MLARSAYFARLTSNFGLPGFPVTGHLGFASHSVSGQHEVKRHRVPIVIDFQGYLVAVDFAFLDRELLIRVGPTVPVMSLPLCLSTVGRRFLSFAVRVAAH